ncbi:aldehyde dehydrogenase family protein [Sphingomonas sp.]|uniref:aldehyde dehydrogenase family protein n=1 Tax=Sphingomonas sp. TaxID=28214 RepID=UPI001B0BE0A1|nr:aldehyde dehydrogenase family protein [Sphingomonas sp.]MBO9711659.1 aldehyde dehydrogenase family protein [Sphingomonas sp.]
MRKVRLFVDGRWCEGSGGAEIDVLDPATGTAVARLCQASDGDLARALDAASRGFDLWRSVSPEARASLLRASAAQLRERVDEIAAVLTAEQGKPIAQARGELLGTIGYFLEMAELALAIPDRSVADAAAGMRRVIAHEPVGPIYAVSPWNMPALLPARKIAIAIAAGCSVVLKPAEETPETIVRIVECCVAAGLPPGVVNLVHGPAAAVSDAMLASPVIRKLSFTGSTAVGRLLSARAGERLIPVSMELGGHAPVIVCEDVDVGATAAALARARHANAGQSCMAPTRFFVADAIHDRFVAAYAAEAAALRIGPGADPATDMGPLATPRRVAAMQRLVDDALGKGARLVTGAAALEGPGWFYPPTVLGDVPSDAAILSEEPFGPVTPILRFADEVEAVAQANTTDYGLAAYVFSADDARAGRIAAQLRTGLVAVNSTQIVSPQVPFGGIGASGNGREGAIEGLLQAMVTKTVSIPLDAG